MAKILITGANGFIGNHLLHSLIGKHELFGMVRELKSIPHPKDVQWIVHDLTQPLDHSILPRQLDTIIHLAQSKQYKNFPEGAKDIFEINIRSTFELLEYARKVGVQRFLFASSGGIYGYSYEKFVETDPVSPLNFYLSSKHSAELLIANYRQFFCTIVFRFFFVYGPGQKGMLVPTLINKVKQGEPIAIEGNPGILINPIYVEDAIRVFEPALRLQISDLFNVAGDEQVTITDLVKIIEKVVGKKAMITYKNIHFQGNLVGDNTRMKERLNVYPVMTLIDGLKTCLQS